MVESPDIENKGTAQEMTVVNIDSPPAIPTEDKAAPASPAPPQTQQPPPDDGGYRWIVLAVSTVAVLLASVQGSALIVALPDVIAGLHTTLLTIMWVLLSYLIAITAVVPFMGAISDILGRCRTFNIGFALFTFASLLCGISQAKHDGWDLVAYRVVQGIGAASVMANSSAVITDAFFKYGQLGLALGVLQIALAVGSILGPLIGGALASNWRWIFYLNVPIGGIATITGFWKITDKLANSLSGTAENANTMSHRLARFDWVGTFFFAGGVVAFLTALSTLALPTMSVAAYAVLYAVGGIMLIGFVVMELLIIKRPLMELRMFADPVFTIGNLASLCMSFSRAIITFSGILYLQGPYMKSPFMAGVLTIPFGAGILLVGFFAGKFSDRVGPKILQIVGPIIACGPTIGIAFIKRSTPYSSFGVALFFVGVGHGLFNSPNGAMVMMCVKPTYRGMASGVRLALAFLGQTLSIMITFGIVLGRLPMAIVLDIFLYGIDPNDPKTDGNIKELLSVLAQTMYIAFAFALAAAVLSLFVPKPKPKVQAVTSTIPSDPVNNK